MGHLKKLIRENRSVIMYLLFGVCTTLINIISYQICYEYADISNVPSTIIAWIISVLFAFVTNKIFVFESKSMQIGVLLFELLTFFGCRAATGIIDVVIMYVAVDVMGQKAVIWKIISNVIVIVLNYAASKLFIFKSK